MSQDSRRRTTGRPVRATGLAVLALVMATACSSGSDEGPGAAEPASAPPTSRAPAGRVVEIGALPQGIVYDAKQDALAVAVHDPYRLLLLDPTTLDVRRTVPLPGKVRHLQVAPNGDVLVPAETADQLLEVPVTGSPQVTDVERHPHDATGADNGDIVVGNEFSGTLSVVRDGTVVRTFTDVEQPGGVIADGDTVAVVDVGAFTLSTYDLDTGKRTGVIDAGSGPTHGALLGGHRVAVADTRGNAILIFDLDPLKQVGRISLPGSPYGLASDPSTDLLWVTLTATNQIVGLNVGTATPTVVATYPTARQPDTVAVAPGSGTLWVTGTADGVVQRITRAETD